MTFRHWAGAPGRKNRQDGTMTVPAAAPGPSPTSVAGRAAAPVAGTWEQLARRQPDPV
jgi:hypothetical protein